MKTTYCQSCGAKNQYEYTKPNFCIGCGTKFSWATVSKPKEVAKKRYEEPEEDEEEFNEPEIPNIKSLKFEIDSDSQRPVTLKNLLGTANALDEEFSRKPVSADQVKRNVQDMRRRVAERARVIEIE